MEYHDNLLEQIKYTLRVTLSPRHFFYQTTFLLEQVEYLRSEDSKEVGFHVTLP